jgi:hypothetical protein
VQDLLAPVPRQPRPLHGLRLLEERMSETNGHKSLLEALLAVQAEAPALPKDGTNPAFKGSKYTKLDTIVDTIGPILNRHGLVWTTLPTMDKQGEPALMYRLIHAATDQNITGTMPLLLGKADSQGFGSAITYARRYSLCAVLNLVADDDDDGHRASQRRAAGASSDTPSESQLKELARQVKLNQPLSSSTLAACLLSVGATGVQGEDLETGAWATKINRAQVSGLIDLFKSSTLPTGESDLPADADDFKAPADANPDEFFEAAKS